MLRKIEEARIISSSCDSLKAARRGAFAFRLSKGKHARRGVRPLVAMVTYAMKHY